MVTFQTADSKRQNMAFTKNEPASFMGFVRNFWFRVLHLTMILIVVF